MPRVNTRPLRDILMDINLRDKPVTRALAEEAARAVVADGVITQDEVDALEPFGDGPMTYDRTRVNESDAWNKGTAAGRALFNGLSDAVEALYDSGNFEARQNTPSPGFNPFGGWWMGGWTSSTSSFHANDKPVPVTAAELLKETRTRGEGRMDNDFEELLKKYPKAQSPRNSQTYVPKRAVQTAYNQIKADWMKGKITDERDLMADLKPLLDSKYR